MDNSNEHFPKEKTGDIFFFHRFFFLVTAVSWLIAMYQAPYQEKAGETACLDDFTQFRVMLPGPRSVVVMALMMTSLPPWYLKKPDKAQNYQPSFIQPHNQTRGQKLLLSAQRQGQYLQRSPLFTYKLQIVPKLTCFWLVNLGLSSYVQMVGAVKLIDTFNYLRYDRNFILLWDFILLFNVNPIHIHLCLGEIKLLMSIQQDRC